VPLPSGGALAIDQTEALVAIDVNSGKTTGDNVEDMAFKTNMEAAEEAARQLRLRDLAGLVVIDFIDMKREGNNRSVMEKLVDCLKEDKARMEVGKINRFGVLVMTRQRLRPSLQQVSHEACPTCQGTGKVKSIEALVLSVVRRIKAILSRDAIAEIRVKLMPAIAFAVLNQKRKDLSTLEDLYDSKIVIIGDPEIPFGEMAAEIERAEEGEAEKAPAKASREKHVEIEDETVVLGGDTPISFEKALGEDSRKPAAQAREPREPREVREPREPRELTEAEIKYDRRDAQRAALDERERLRALFESAKPLDEDGEPIDAPAAPEKEKEKEKAGPRRRGRGNRKPLEGAAPRTAAEAEPEPQEPQERLPELTPELTEVRESVPVQAWIPVQVQVPAVKPAPVPEPPPILLTADLVADLLTPSPRPRLGGAAKETPAVPEAAPAAAKRGRKPKAEVAAPAEAPAPAPAKRGPKPRAAKVAEAAPTGTPKTRKK